MNLAVNARDAMPRGGRLMIATHNVELTRPYARGHAGTAPPGRYVVLAVRDTGDGHGRGDAGAHLRAVLHDQGARQGHRARAGDRVRHRQAERRAHPRRQRAGPGDDVHDLPAAGRAAAEASRRRSRARSSRARRAGHETILLVEDEEDVRALVAAGAARRTATRCSRPAAARRRSSCASGHRAPIDLLLTDVVMPRAERARAGRAAADGPAGDGVLFMSGYTDHPAVRQAEGDGSWPSRSSRACWCGGWGSGCERESEQSER